MILQHKIGTGSTVMMTQTLCGTFGKKLLFQCVDKHAPLQLGHTSVEEKNALYDVLKVRVIRSGNGCDWLIFKKCRNTVNNETMKD